MIVKLLTEHHLEFLSLNGGCTGSSESTLVKMSYCWKSHTSAQMYVLFCFLCVSGIFPPEYPETNIVSLFERWKMYGDPVKQKQMPVLSI